MKDDPREEKEMRKMAEEDHVVIMEQLDDLQYEIEEAIIPKNDYDWRSCTIEIR